MNTDSKTELLPCPFCGGEAEAKKTDMSYDFTLIKCQECDAQSDERIDLEDAAEAWNRRAPSVPVPQWGKSGTCEWHDGYADHSDGGGPYKERVLYTAPKQTEVSPVRDPLTDAEIESATGAKQGTPLFLAAKGFTIAVERAHGIGSKDT